MKFLFNPLQLLTFILSFSLLLIISCNKERSQGSDEEQQAEASRVSSEADSEAEIVFNGLFDDAIGVNTEVGIGGTGVFGRIFACPDVTVIRLNSPAPFPVKIVLDFGATGCMGNDGHLRKGKIIAEYSGPLLIPGASATAIFDGFYLDSTKVEATYKITNISPAIPTTPPTRQFRVEVNGAKLIRPSGSFIDWTSVKVITQIAGLDTGVPTDDVFKIEGNAHGKVKRGPLVVAWESLITEPLVKRFDCRRWIVRGKVRTVRATSPVTGPWVAVLDFGTSGCDNRATITINGILHQITLP